MTSAKSDHEALREWLETIQYNGFRAIENRQPAVHVDGRRLRGIEVADGIYMTRSKKFYAIVPNVDHVVEMTLNELLDATTLETIKGNFSALCRVRRSQRNNN